MRKQAKLVQQTEFAKSQLLCLSLYLVLGLHVLARIYLPIGTAAHVTCEAISALPREIFSLNAKCSCYFEQHVTTPAKVKLDLSGAREINQIVDE